MPVNQIIDKRNKDIKIYINGSFFDRDDAKISVFDSGFLLGDGIWEGIRLVDNNWVSYSKKTGVTFNPSEDNNNYLANTFNRKEVDNLGQFLDLIYKRKTNLSN